MSAARVAQAARRTRLPKLGQAAPEAKLGRARHAAIPQSPPARQLPDTEAEPAAARLPSAWELGRIHLCKWTEIAALGERASDAPRGSRTSRLAEGAYDAAVEQAFALDAVILASPASNLADAAALAVHAWLRTEEFDGDRGSPTSSLVHRALAHVALAIAEAGKVDLGALGDGVETLARLQASAGLAMQVAA